MLGGRVRNDNNNDAAGELLNNEEEGVGRVGGDGPPPLRVSLSNCPRTPYDLWLEWTTGLGGIKQQKISPATNVVW